LIGFGIALVVNSLAMLGGVVVFAIMINQLVILKEEKYLTEKFGDAYQCYKSSVRRWL
jgi:protein-S-isoprenylcysteine O-methyltransferase Ste14